MNITLISTSDFVAVRPERRLFLYREHGIDSGDDAAQHEWARDIHVVNLCMEARMYIVGLSAQLENIPKNEYSPRVGKHAVFLLYSRII